MERPEYIEKLKNKMHNGMIKVITGLRRCGKSYLLFNLFYRYLQESGVKDDHIIRLQMDDWTNREYRDPDKLYAYVRERVSDEGQYYILLDEVQLVRQFEDVLNGFLHIGNTDTYVTGSNARFLSKDIITEFRGRGDQIHLQPLSFSEFMTAYDGHERDGWQQYITFGGLPKLLEMKTDQEKSEYLRTIFEETYIMDIVERNRIRNSAELEELLDVVASSIGGLTNPKKLSDTFRSVKDVTIHPDTVKSYLDCFEDSFLISKARRYDVKGKRYINTPMKYYFSDCGLRNARLGFRQIEETHLMENVIYNELIRRGYSVDVGCVDDVFTDENGRRTQKQLEIDFVCNLGSGRIYIQSALALPTLEKVSQEQRSLLKVNDSFRKMIVVKDGMSHFNDEGVLILNLFDFLMKRTDASLVL